MSSYGKGTPFPFRSVISDPTGRSQKPPVGKYGRPRCYWHYAKMMAFNAAFHRYAPRHAWMGFFDVDEFLGAGDSIEDVLEEYPSLSREDVLACLSYTSRLMGNHFRLEPVA